MKLIKISQIEDFLQAVNAAKDNVWLTSIYGDKYNLKSPLSQYYIVIKALLRDKGDELELFCDNKEDEALFLSFFYNHPEV